MIGIIKGLTPLHLAASEGNLKLVKLFAEKYKETVKDSDNGGRTPMIWAAIKGRKDVVKYFAENHEATLSDSYDNGCSILHIIAKENHRDIFPLLKGFIPREAWFSWKDSHDRTPFDYVDKESPFYKDFKMMKSKE